MGLGQIFLQSLHDFAPAELILPGPRVAEVGAQQRPAIFLKLTICSTTLIIIFAASRCLALDSPGRLPQC
jgi:hypothetical protein